MMHERSFDVGERIKDRGERGDCSFDRARNRGRGSVCDVERGGRAKATSPCSLSPSSVRSASSRRWRIGMLVKAVLRRLVFVSFARSVASGANNPRECPSRSRLRAGRRRRAAGCPEIVCSINLALIRGIPTGPGENAAAAVLEPRSGECCVAIHTRGH